MGDKSFSDINEGWLQLCDEYKSTRYNRDILLFQAFNKLKEPDVNTLDNLEDAESALEEIEKRMNDYREKYNFNLQR